MTPFDRARRHMVERQISDRGVRDPLVLAAMRKVPREALVSKGFSEDAYADRPLPIGDGQTISQPFIVALMVESLALKGGEKVLEVGAGSGYAAAVLSEIAGEVYAIERIGTLAKKAARNLKAAGYGNVHVLHGDGTRGWADHAPFDAILVSAGSPGVPETLKDQLAPGGRMVIPVGDSLAGQDLIRITRRETGRYDYEVLADVRFVPLIGGEAGLSEDEDGEEKTANAD
ncbi:MAG: protein-L-isoaspartate(D-aspartate) O-methyltransferase [Pseudomonadota bacterium]